jgi:hypothetical protein
MADKNDSGSVNMTNKRRFTDITNQQVNTILEDKDALNTKRSTKEAVWLFRKYLLEKEVDTDFEHFDMYL